MNDLIVQDPPSKKSRRTKEPTLGASSATQSLVFPPGLLIGVQAATQEAAQPHAPPIIPASNFLIDDIDDNFSDTNDAVNDIVASPLADAASTEDPIVSVPINPIEVPVDAHPTADSCVTGNNASSMLLPIDAAAAGAGNGGCDDDSVPTSDDTDDDDGDNESQQSNQDNVDGNESQRSYHTCDGHHSDLFENCFECVPITLMVIDLLEHIAMGYSDRYQHRSQYHKWISSL